MFLKSIMSAVIAISLTAPAVAGASERKPFHPRTTKTTDVTVSEAGKLQRVVRERTLGRDVVRFSADPMPLDEGGVMLFEVRTKSDAGTELRWRCIAVDDVSDCLGETLTVEWGAHDHAAELTMVLEPIAAPEGMALLAEARRMQLAIGRESDR